MASDSAPAPAHAGEAACPICRGTAFGPAPGGRLSRRGLPPRCLQCRSLERHRAGRDLMERIRDRERFRAYALLQFGDDPIVAKGWFRTAEVSPAAGDGALDPQAIARPDGAFDVVISSHVVTRVADHRLALREIMRVLSREGFAFIAYPSPLTRAETQDWGFADPARNGNHRILGRDFEAELRKLLGAAYLMAVRVPDPVTGDEDLVYLATRNFFWTRRLLAARYEVKLID
jgi:SAM-dependent methyltransferase